MKNARKPWSVPKRGSRIPSHSPCEVRRSSANCAWRNGMKMLRMLLLLHVGLVTLASCKSGASTATSEESLPPEQSQVYSDFLERFSKLHFTSLSNRTFSFDLS